MGKNRGKQFENVIRSAFEKADGVSIDRLHDQTTGFYGSTNIADIIVYRKPYEYYFELKSVHGNTLSIHSNDPSKKYGNITNKQWEGLLEKSQIPGVFAGVICWWVDKNVTRFIPIQALEYARTKAGAKSIRYDDTDYNYYEVFGKKKRVFFEYDVAGLLDALERSRA